jgi:folate-binding protein YgfZ
MGMVHHHASLLVLQGENILNFLDGLTTNAVAGSCTTIFAERTAKIIDVCEVVVIGERVVLVGYGPHQTQLVQHLQHHLLGRNITVTDVSHLNRVYIGTGDETIPENATVHSSFFGVMYIVPNATAYTPTWTNEDWTEHRIENILPFYGHEISPQHHPLACGLAELVHPNKGCYIGQEVLTRMRSRGKQGHRLVVMDNPAQQATTVGRAQSLCIVRDQ